VLLSFASEFGISEVEAKQRLMGGSGAEWEIDAKGIKADGEGFLVIECKQRTNAGIKQSDVAALAFTIRDLNADGAVIVTSVDPQKGAKIIAENQGFKVVFLPKESTFSEFIASCGARLAIRDRGIALSVSLVNGAYTKPDYT